MTLAEPDSDEGVKKYLWLQKAAFEKNQSLILVFRENLSERETCVKSDVKPVRGEWLSQTQVVRILVVFQASHEAFLEPLCSVQNFTLSHDPAHSPTFKISVSEKFLPRLSIFSDTFFPEFILLLCKPCSRHHTQLLFQLPKASRAIHNHHDSFLHCSPRDISWSIYQLVGIDLSSA